MAYADSTQWQNTLWKPPSEKIIDGMAYRCSDVCVHTIRVGDCEDPDLWVAAPIVDWELSEAGQFVMSRAVETPYWMRDNNLADWCITYKIMARLTDQDQTYWQLKWGNNQQRRMT